MKRDIRIIGKERTHLDVGKFVLALVSLSEHLARRGEGDETGAAAQHGAEYIETPLPSDVDERRPADE